MVKNTYYGAEICALLSDLLSFHPFQVQIFFSAPCSQTVVCLMVLKTVTFPIYIQASCWTMNFNKMNIFTQE
jgi:hypothetical protein